MTGMIVGTPAALSCTMTMLMLSSVRSFVRPITPVAVVGSRLNKLHGVSQAHSSAMHTTAPARMSLQTEEEKIMYAFGAALAKQTDQFKNLLSTDERATALQGFTDHWRETKLEVEPMQYAEKVNEILENRQKDKERNMAEKGAGFLEAAAKEEGATQTASGLVVQTMTEGTGAQPTGTDVVKVHYHGTLVDGSVFDSSVLRGSPISFPLNGVIKGWTEGVQLMKVGGKSKLTIPPELAYGEQGTGPIPPKSTLQFEVELLAIE